jgi:hypothetical protein
MDGRPFSTAADGAGAEKRCGFNRDANLLRYIHDGANVVFMRARRTVGLDFHPLRGDFPGQRFGVRKSAWPGAW